MKPGLQSRVTGRHLRYAEYGLLVVIISIIVLFLLDQVGGMHKKAERLAVLGEINAMRGKVVSSLDSGFSDGSSGRKESNNPVRIMQKKPDNYLGEISHPEQLKITAGSWYFNTQNGFLVYKSRYEHKFPFNEQAVTKIRLALMPLEQAEGNSTFKVLSCGPKLCLTTAEIP